MTVCVVIAADPGSCPGYAPGIQRNGGSMLRITVVRSFVASGLAPDVKDKDA